jgi:DNA-binding protein Fis
MPVESADTAAPDDMGDDIFNGLFGRFPTLHEVEEYMINRAMKLADGRLTVAAALLGITRQGLHKRIK